MKTVFGVREQTMSVLNLVSDPIAVTLGFFDDIYVPLVYLPEPSAL